MTIRERVLDLALWLGSIVTAGAVLACAVWYGPPALLWIVEFVGGGS